MKLRTPLDEKVIKSLKAGDMLYLSGTIYTGRDAAHQKLVDLLKEGKELPVNLKGQTIYYVGPAPKNQAELSVLLDQHQVIEWILTLKR